MNEITLDGGTFRRIQHNGHTYWESVHPFPGVVMWFDNTDETTRPYRTLACALDRIAEMEADDAVKSEAFRKMWDHSRAVNEKLAAVNAARTLTLTPAEWDVLQRDGTAWIVRDGEDCTLGDRCYTPHDGNAQHPPAELVAAAAPCETYGGKRQVLVDGDENISLCPSCRITLVGECPTCEGRGWVLEQHDYASEQLGCQECMGRALALGYAYADSEVQMIWRPGVPADDTQWATLVATLGFDPSADIGRYALKVRLA